MQKPKFWPQDVLKKNITLKLLFFNNIFKGMFPF